MCRSTSAANGQRDVGQGREVSFSRWGGSGEVECGGGSGGEGWTGGARVQEHMTTGRVWG
jgi:hypothetical protein